MDLGLTGARALIGGGSRGLGGAIAEALAARAPAWLSSRGPARASRRRRAGSTRSPSRPTSRRPTDPRRRSRRRSTRSAGSTCWSSTPAARRPGASRTSTRRPGRRAIDGTLLSAVRLLRAALPHLREGRDPAILVILSSSVREPIPGLTTSNLIRPGLAGLIKSLVEEIAPVRINGLAPGRVRDRPDRPARRGAGPTAAGVAVEEIQRRTIERIPLGRYGDPLELGRVGAFLLSPAASYVTGAIVPVDGGMIRALP